MWLPSDLFRPVESFMSPFVESSLYLCPLVLMKVEMGISEPSEIHTPVVFYEDSQQAKQGLGTAVKDFEK